MAKLIPKIYSKKVKVGIYPWFEYQTLQISIVYPIIQLFLKMEIHTNKTSRMTSCNIGMYPSEEISLPGIFWEDSKYLYPKKERTSINVNSEVFFKIPWIGAHFNCGIPLRLLIYCNMTNRKNSFQISNKRYQGYFNSISFTNSK